jgi:hypothetical protein
MPGPNSEPIFSRVADIQWEVEINTANNNQDLTTVGSTSYEVFVADATNGGFVRNARVKVNPGTTAVANTAATVVRFWLNNGSTTGTAANSALIGELGLPSTTASASAPQADFDYGLNMALPPGYKIYITIGSTLVGGSAPQLTCTIFGGKY